MIKPLALPKSSIRILLYGIVISFLFDIIHLSLRSAFYWDYELFFHDTERGVRRFSLICAYLLVFFKFFQMVAMWKVSVDYNEILNDNTKKHVIDIETDSEI